MNSAAVLGMIITQYYLLLSKRVTKCQNPWVRQTLASAETLLPPFPLHPLRHSEMLSVHVEYLQPS